MTMAKAKLPRGFTAQSAHSPESRPPKLQGRVYNDFYPEKARSAVMPPPTGDTEEPRLSKRKGPLSKGRR
jgi:hypothetical protein